MTFSHSTVAMPSIPQLRADFGGRVIGRMMSGLTRRGLCFPVGSTGGRR